MLGDTSCPFPFWKADMTVLNCLLGEALSDVARINGVGGAWGVLPSPGCQARAPSRLVGPALATHGTAPVAFSCWHCIPCAWGLVWDVLGAGKSSGSFMEWIDKDDLKEFVRGMSTNR